MALERNLNEDAPVVKETAGMFALNLRDAMLGAIVAAAAAGIDVLITAVNAWVIEKIPFVIDWRGVADIALAAGLAYLTKNFLTAKKTIVFSPPQEVRITDKETGATLKPDNESLKSRHETIKPPQS
jgi:hypothetical protein